MLRWCSQTILSAWMKDCNPQLGRYDFTEVSVSFTSYLVGTVFDACLLVLSELKCSQNKEMYANNIKQTVLQELIFSVKLAALTLRSLEKR